MEQDRVISQGISQGQGDLLDADVEALVNTVNTVGVMGKGIALQFKRAFPEMFKAYERAAKSGQVQLGRMHVWETGLMQGPRLIINFPTKGHWRSRSSLADIESGLDDLLHVVKEHEIRSLAMPPLGCGHGGLEWADVEPLIRQKLDSVPDLHVELFAPVGAPAPAQMRDAGSKPNMTKGRAALIEMLGRYSDIALGATPLEAQKLMYFLQVAGEPLRLGFAANRYGPYADNLRAVLREVEGHYVIGFGDGSTPVLEAPELHVLAQGVAEADAFLGDTSDTRDRVERVMQLVEGYESAYSVELLATVHWTATHPSAEPDATEESVIDAVRSWSARKGRMFTPDHIRAALGRLREGGWLATVA